MTDTQTQDKWRELQDDIAEFTDKTFGHQTSAVPKLHHLREEVGELIESPDDRLEWADCMILLLDAAKKGGYTTDDLYDFVNEKMEINKKRKWGAPDENGVMHHIKETA